MGSCRLEPTPVLEKPSEVARSDDHTATWLDALLTLWAPHAITPWQAQQIRPRLKELPLTAVLAAIERAQPGLGIAPEIAIYKEWIEANNPASPLLDAAWFNLGAAFARAGDYGNAATAFSNALALRPGMHQAAINLGLMLELSDRRDQALATWQAATQPDQARNALRIQQGRLLETLGRFEEAEKTLRHVLLVDPAQPDVLHHWIHIRQKSCQWPVTPANMPGLTEAQLLQSSGPLGILGLTDDVDLQCAAAAAWVARKTVAAPRRLAPAGPYAHERIKIGYLSSDFCSHAMSYLIAELFERHDRRYFEVFGYCSSVDDATPLRQRVLAAFDTVRMIRALSDEQAAELIRNDEIDILIDLNGITDGSRLPVLRWRPAPIQATYLGFIGPVPLPELDYLLCDNTVVPPQHANSYQPNPLPIASVFQANDTRRTIGPRLSRAQAGLPEDRFVFCCFAKHYKITEEMFAAWMAVMRQTDRTVLWLVADNPFSQANLLAAAANAGIASSRLIFSERADPDLYLSRLALADLYIDTFPYNSGTVASDALRMQLPLLTLCGKAFASRMATSLLQALGASQGITTSLPEYVDTAIRLASYPDEYAHYKALFTQQAWDQSIGNIARFTMEFEQTCRRMVAAHARLHPCETNMASECSSLISHNAL